MALAGGGDGIDYKKYRKKLLIESIYRVAKIEEIDYNAATPEQRAFIEKEAQSLANSAFQRAVDVYKGVPWVDAWGEDVTEEIMKVWAPFRPFVAIAKPHSIMDDPFLSKGDIKTERPLSVFSREAPSTVLTAMLKTGGSWGSEEVVESLRGGIDPFLELPLWGDAVLQNFYDDPRSAPFLLRKYVGLAIVLPMILIEPDPVSIGMGIFAPFVKIGKVASGLSRMSAKANRATEVVELLQKGEIGGAEALWSLSKKDPEVRLAVETEIAAQLGRPVAQAFEALSFKRERAAELLEEAAAIEAAAIQKHGPVKMGGRVYGGDPKAGLDSLTFAEFRAQNQLKAHELLLEASVEEAAIKATLAKEGLRHIPPDELANINSYRDGQKATNSQLKALNAERRELTSAGKTAQDDLNVLYKQHHDAVLAIPEIKEGFSGKVKARGRNPLSKKERAHAEVVGATFEGDNLMLHYKLPGTEGVTIMAMPIKTLSEESRRIVVISRQASEQAYKRWYEQFGKRIAEIDTDKQYLLRMKESFKSGGPLRMLMDASKAADEALDLVVRQYNKTYTALGKAQKAKATAAGDLRYNLERAAQQKLSANEALEVEGVAIQALTTVRDSMAEHVKYVKANYGGVKAIGKRWDELKSIGKVNHRVAQIAAAKVIAKGFTREGAERMAWQPQVVEDLLKEAYGEFADAVLAGESWQDLKKAAGSVPDQQAAVLQQYIENMALRMEINQTVKSERAYGAAIQGAWEDLEIAKRGDVRQQLAGGIATLTRKFDYIGKNLGNYGDAVGDALRAGENISDLGFTEMRQATRKVAAKDQMEAISLFITESRQGVMYKQGASVLGSILMGEPLWEAGRRGIVGATLQNPRTGRTTSVTEDMLVLNPRLAPDVDLRAPAKQAAMLEDNLREMLKLAKKAEKRGEEFHMDMAALEELLLKMDNRALDEVTKHGLNPMVRTIALSALPHGVRLGEETLPPVFYAVTIQALKDPTLSLDELETLLRGLTQATLGPKQVGSKLAQRTKIAAALIQGAAFDRMASHIKMATGGVLDMGDTIAFNRMLSGETTQLGEKGGVRAMQAAIKMGTPFTEEAHRLRGDAEAMSKQLVEIGDMAIVPETVVKAMERKFSGYLNELVPFHRDGVEDPTQIAKLRDLYVHLWKMSTVTGMGVPNPRYWVNNVFGDFSQMWSEVGLARSTALSFQNILPNFGAGGRFLHNWALQGGERLDKAGRKMGLPSVVEAMFNPYLGRMFKGQPGTFRGKGGKVFQFEDVTRWGTEDGILDTFVHEEILKQMARRSRLSDKFKGFKNWQEDLSEAATLVQQRQRMALYADLLQRGATRAEAKKKTLNALYDWKHGIAKAEMGWVMNMVPFYRFWRLAMKQVRGSMLEAFTKPSGTYLADAMRGRTQLARARQQSAVAYGLPDIFFSENPDDAIGQSEEYNELYKVKFPAWADNRAIIGAQANSLAKRQWYEENLGRTATHTAYTLPPFTMLDSFAMANSGLALLGWIGQHSKRAIPFTDKFDRSPLADQVDAMAFEPFLGMTFPGMEYVLRTMASKMDLQLQYTNQSSHRNLSPAEEAVMSMTPIGRSYIIKDPKTGKSKVPSAIYYIFRSLPLAGTQLPYLASAKTSNPYWDPQTTIQRDPEAYKFAFRQLSRLGTEYGYDPRQMFEYEQKAIKDRLTKTPWKDEVKVPSHRRKAPGERYPLLEEDE